VVACAAQEHVVRRDGEAGLALDPLQGRLELTVGERLHAPALAADEMVMVVAVVDALVVRAVAAEVDLLDEALLDEQVERPVDARDAVVLALSPGGLDDLGHADAAVLTRQHVDDDAARTRRAVALAAKELGRLLAPAHGRKHT